MKFLFRHVLHPTWHAIKRDGVNRAWRELRQNQWRPEAELLSLQQRKLAALLTFAGTYVPYYRELFEHIGLRTQTGVTSTDFRKITPLTKEIVRKNQKSLVSENLLGNKLTPNSTSGSTGQAIKFFTDSRSKAYRAAAEQRSNEFTGWRFGEKWMTLWGAPMDAPTGKAVNAKLRGVANRRVFLSSFDLGPKRLQEYVDQIGRFEPKLIVGYPGPLEQLAMFCQSRHIEVPSLLAIVSSAETLWPHQRETIEKAFNVKVFDRYGSREVGQVASECNYHDGLHVSVDRVLIEIVDDDGGDCEPGETGRILITDLDNYGMPLIRYDIGDRAIAADESGPCRCGRGLPRIRSIEGRTLEVVEAPDGTRVGGTFWTLLLRSRAGFAQFQVIQNELSGVIINYVRDFEVDEPDFSYFSGKIKARCGSDFNVEFREVERIDLTGAGKQRLIISNVTRRETSDVLPT